VKGKRSGIGLLYLPTSRDKLLRRGATRAGPELQFHKFERPFPVMRSYCIIPRSPYVVPFTSDRTSFCSSFLRPIRLTSVRKSGLPSDGGSLFICFFVRASAARFVRSQVSHFRFYLSTGTSHRSRSFSGFLVHASRQIDGPRKRSDGIKPLAHFHARDAEITRARVPFDFFGR